MADSQQMNDRSVFTFSQIHGIEYSLQIDSEF